MRRTNICGERESYRRELAQYEMIQEHPKTKRHPLWGRYVLWKEPIHGVNCTRFGHRIPWAAAKKSQVRPSTQLLLSFSPFLVVYRVYGPCTSSLMEERATVPSTSTSGRWMYRYAEEQNCLSEVAWNRCTWFTQPLTCDYALQSKRLSLSPFLSVCQAIDVTQNWNGGIRNIFYRGHREMLHMLSHVILNSL